MLVPPLYSCRREFIGPQTLTDLKKFYLFTWTQLDASSFCPFWELYAEYYCLPCGMCILCIYSCACVHMPSLYKYFKINARNISAVWNNAILNRSAEVCWAIMSTVEKSLCTPVKTESFGDVKKKGTQYKSCQILFPPLVSCSNHQNSSAVSGGFSWHLGFIRLPKPRTEELTKHVQDLLVKMYWSGEGYKRIS